MTKLERQLLLQQLRTGGAPSGSMYLIPVGLSAQEMAEFMARHGTRGAGRPDVFIEPVEPPLIESERKHTGSMAHAP